jgi:predicted dehydrogenase
MTERFEITSILQRELSQRPELFGTLLQGSAADPAIRKESVHHFSKIVAGQALKRPQWFFDVRQQGEGLVDVTTHLVDLVQWQAFPEQALKPEEAKVLHARRSRTPLTLEQFHKVTGAQSFPDYLQTAVKDGVLNVHANGEFTYRIRDVHALISVRWDFEAPAGAGDTHSSVMRGSKANLTIQQGAAEQYKPVLYIERAANVSKAAHETAINNAIASLQRDYPGVGVRRDAERWAVAVPERYNVGHEAHFAQVTENFLKYLRSGKLPAWEVPNMLTKYATLMQAYELSRPE